MFKPAFAAAVLAACAFVFGPISAAAEGGHAQGDTGQAIEMDSAILGDMMIEAPVIRATTPHAPAAGGFMRITNMGTADDTLLAASIGAEIAGMAQLHTMSMDGDVMRMQEVAGGIAIPAGETVQLAPGGLHVMLMRLEAPMVEGDHHEITLMFENAGEVTLNFAVISRAGVAHVTQASGGHGHGDH